MTVPVPLWGEMFHAEAHFRSDGVLHASFSLPMDLRHLFVLIDAGRDVERRLHQVELSRAFRRQLRSSAEVESTCAVIAALWQIEGASGDSSGEAALRIGTAGLAPLLQRAAARARHTHLVASGTGVAVLAAAVAEVPPGTFSTSTLTFDEPTSRLVDAVVGVLRSEHGAERTTVLRGRVGAEELGRIIVINATSIRSA